MKASYIPLKSRHLKLTSVQVSGSFVIRADPLDPTELTLASLEKYLLEAETSTVAVGAFHGTPSSPFLEGYAPSPLIPSVATAAAVDLLGAEEVGAASAPGGKRRSGKGKGGKGGGSGISGGGSGDGGGGGRGGGGGTGGGGSGGGWGGGGGGGGGGGWGGAGRGGGYGDSARGHQLPRLPDTPTPWQLREWVVQLGSPGGFVRCSYVRRTEPKKGQTCRRPGHTEYRCFGRLDDVWVTRYGDEQKLPNWLHLIAKDVDVFAPNFFWINKAIYAMYVDAISAKGACYSCVPCTEGVGAAALGTSASAATGASEFSASAEALHTFTLNSSASCCFFRECTTVIPLAAPVPVSLADPCGGPIVARASTVLPCLAVPSGSLSGLHLPSFSTYLVRNAVLQDVWVDTLTLGGQRVAICMRSRTGGHFATFTRQPGSSLYTLTSASVQVAASRQESVSGQLAGMHSRLLVSGLPRSLTPLPRSLAPPCLPCVEGRQHAAPHSSEFPPTTAPLQTLHMDMWGPAPIRGMDQECYFLLIVDDYTRYTIVFSLRSKADVCGAVSSLPASFRRSVKTRASSSQTSPTLRWTGEVGDASAFWVWGALSLVHDTTVSKLSPCTLRCVFLGFPRDAPPCLFYHFASRQVLSSQDVTFDESVYFHRVEPLVVSSDTSDPVEGGDPAADNTATTRRSPCLETLPGFPPRLTLPPLHPVAVDIGSTGGGDTGGEESGGAGPGGAEIGGEGSGGAETRGEGSEGADSGGAASPSGGGCSCCRSWSPRAAGAGGTTGTAGARGAAGAGGAIGAGGTKARGAGGARAAGTGGARAGGAGAAEAGGIGGARSVGTRGARARGAGVM
ncbi:unnamed protein product [Closterium sp. NIES-54]